MGPIPFIPFNNDFSRHEDFMANDEIFTENGNEIFTQQSYILFKPTLEDLKNVLYAALNPFFEEFEIAVVSCPTLIRAPYNLAAAGLSGNTGILSMGSFNSFRPRPRTNFAYDLQHRLSRCSCDVFVIGSGFAAKPSMAYNGHFFDSWYKFNTFSTYESVGEFFNDVTPEETEYIAYLNIAQEICL